jgi:hypothetical protein
MKKFIQICSLLSLIVIFTMAASASVARPEYGSEVAIPFSFNVANKAYTAGTYIVKLVKLPTGAATLSIYDTRTGDRQTVIVTANGDRAGNEVKLVFETAGGKKYLTKIQTPGDTFALVGSKTRNDKVGQIETTQAADGGSGF